MIRFGTGKEKSQLLERVVQGDFEIFVQCYLDVKHNLSLGTARDFFFLIRERLQYQRA